jgi:hypothetical protein
MSMRFLPLTVALGALTVSLAGCEGSPPRGSWDAKSPVTPGTDASAPAGDGPGVSDGPGPAVDTPPGMLGPGAPVTLTVPPERAAAIQQLKLQVEQDQPATAEAFAARWKPEYRSSLGFDPLKAMHLDLIQASPLRLNDAESAKFGQNAFVISGRQAFPTFFYGYKAIYASDLPVFISADSILYAVHRSYDAILKELEQAQLIEALNGMLAGMHQALGSGTGAQLSADVRADADLYLTVARRLLLAGGGAFGNPAESVAPLAGAKAADADKLVELAMAASGLAKVPLFGDPERAMDFSQFKPRGHYAGEQRMEAYFRAMIWLGRTDLRLIEDQRFIRRQFDVALLLSLLLDASRQQVWKQIDQVLAGFVGESDNMTVLDFERLRVALNVPALADLAGRTDQQLAQAITAGSFGIQRIASQILFVPPDGLNAPLDRAFLLFGQRYILDSEVFSNVVFDRVLPEGGERRMLPSSFDTAFAALGNTHAAPFLAAELGKYKNYPAALHRARLLADNHEPAFWSGSLYHAWLGTLRAMSPEANLNAQAPGGPPRPYDPGLPGVARTQAWSRRVLNTQLASWAELRHDTLLYAKQSYTGYPVCEFPDAYVDPYPEMWKALAGYAQRGKQIVAQLPQAAQGRAMIHFTELATVAGRLEDMARRQLTGMPFTAEQLAWVNEVVNIREQPNCGGPIQVPDGWYVKLFYDRNDSIKQDPTIADVHTNPVDSQVLHVATGNPRLMIMTAETCVGPRAYVGLASAYHEKLTTGFKRMTDMEWAEELKTFPADVEWMKDVVVR